MVLEEAFYRFRWNLLGASFYFIVIMTLKGYIFPLNSIPSYFKTGPTPETAIRLGDTGQQIPFLTAVNLSQHRCAICGQDQFFYALK